MAICVGCGLDVNDSGVLEVDLADDTTGDGHSGIHCDNTAGLSLVVQHDGSLTGNGTSAVPLRVNSVPPSTIPISPDACNGLHARGNGLWAPCPQEYTCTQNVGFFGGAIPFGVNTGGDATFNLASQCGANVCSTCPAGADGRITFCNPSPCCSVEGFWDVQAYGGAVDANPGFNATAELQISFNGGGFVGGSPATFIRMQNQGAGVERYDLSNMLERDYIILGASGCVDLQARIQVHVFSGTGTWAVGPNFEFHFGPLVQVQGCCG